MAVRFRSNAGAVHKGARTNLGRAGEELDSDTSGAVVEFAVKFTVAEARRSDESLAVDWAPTTYVRYVFQRG